MHARISRMLLERPFPKPHRMSSISTAKLERPCTGESAEKVRSINAWMGGRAADATGANKPQEPSSATAIVARITVDLPAMLGPARGGHTMTQTDQQTAVSSGGMATVARITIDLPCLDLATAAAADPTQGYSRFMLPCQQLQLDAATLHNQAPDFEQVCMTG